jgi:hypothetical protein
MAREMDLSVAGWTPARVLSDGSAPMVEWCWTGHEPFTDPFFEQTLDRSVRRPFSLVFRPRTPIEGLAGISPGLRPDGFVFHTARCGSTVVTQMLAASPRNLVLSEPRPVDSVLRLTASRTERIDWLRSLVGALGRPPRGEVNYVLKLDAWSVLALPLIRAAFPETPWLFLYRDPVEILVSQLSHRGAHMVPGALPPDLFGLEPDSVVTMASEEYCARVLGAICEAALDGEDERAMFVEYRELPDVVVGPIAELFGLEITPAERRAALAAARLDAKNPVLPFEDDSAEKRALATAAVREAAERWVGEPYRRLEEARRRQREPAAC